MIKVKYIGANQPPELAKEMQKFYEDNPNIKVINSSHGYLMTQMGYIMDIYQIIEYEEQ